MPIEVDIFAGPTSPPDVDSTATSALGIFPSDLILRTAIKAGFEDIRANPWLLDYVFAWIAQDQLTKNLYGTKTIAAAKRWFLKEKIEVVEGVRPPDGGPQKNCVSIAVMASDEVENTLGDVDPFVSEDTEAIDPTLTLPFDPVSYDAATGRMVLPETVTDVVVPSIAMAVTDRSGRSYPIVDVESGDTILVAEGTVADFNKCRLRTVGAPYKVGLEGVTCKESYLIGCHAHGEPAVLTYLHAITLFVLYRYRQVLLVERGLERVQVSSKEVAVDGLTPVESYWSRYISLTGHVRHVWPKVSSRILAVERAVTPADAGITITAPWDPDADSLSGIVER